MCTGGSRASCELIWTLGRVCAPRAHPPRAPCSPQCRAWQVTLDPEHDLGRFSSSTVILSAAQRRGSTRAAPSPCVRRMWALLGPVGSVAEAQAMHSRCRPSPSYHSHDLGRVISQIDRIPRYQCKITPTWGYYMPSSRSYPGKGYSIVAFTRPDTSRISAPPEP